MKTKLLYIAGYIICTSALTFAQTNVSGSIYSNTTWTKANSPYIVTDTVVVFQNITLTIEPGVIIQFDNSKGLKVRGHLQANGTPADSISFTSSSPIPTKGIWQGIETGGLNAGTAFFNYCKIEYAEYGIDIGWGWGGNGPVSAHKTIFYENERGIYGYGNFNFILDSCVFENNRYGIHGTNFQVSNSIFQNNETGIDGGDVVTGSFFCGNNTGAKLDGTMDNCVVVNNNLGIDYNCFATNTVIAFNVKGARVSDNFGSNNIICKNDINIENVNTNPINALNNCWCTTDSLTIADKIYDGYDNLSLGLIDFTPYIICDSSAIPSIDTSQCQYFTLFTGINENSNVETVLIYPNPTSNNLTIELSKQSSQGDIRIFNALGQLELSSRITHQKINLDVSVLPSGVHILEVETNNNISRQKFIKQ